MADVTPNYDLERMTLELERAQLALNVQAQMLRIAQSEDDIRRMRQNIEATKASIVQLDSKLKA